MKEWKDLGSQGYIYWLYLFYAVCPTTHNPNSNPVRAQMTLHQGIERDFVGVRVIMSVVSRLRMPKWDFATEMSSQYGNNHVAALIKQSNSLHGFTVVSKAAVLIAHAISSIIFVMNR